MITGTWFVALVVLMLILCGAWEYYTGRKS